MTNSLDQPQKTKKKKGVAKPISLNRIKIKNLNSAVAVAAVALACLAVTATSAFASTQTGNVRPVGFTVSDSRTISFTAGGQIALPGYCGPDHIVGPVDIADNMLSSFLSSGKVKVGITTENNIHNRIMSVVSPGVSNGTAISIVSFRVTDAGGACGGRTYYSHAEATGTATVEQAYTLSSHKDEVVQSSCPVGSAKIKNTYRQEVFTPSGYTGTIYKQLVSVDDSACNAAPNIPATAAYAIDEDTVGTHTVAITDVDAGDTHSIEVTAQPANGKLAISGAVVTYTPNKDWNGTETFKVRAKDKAGAQSGIQTVTVTVKPVNDAPAIPVATTLTIDEDTTGTHTVVITDPDLGMPSDSHTLEVTQQPANGTVASTKSGNNFVLTYKPNKDWNGTDTVKVRVKDAAGVSSGIQTLTITVKPVNDAPTIPATAAYAIDEDTTGSHAVVITDADFNMPGDSHTIEVTDNPKNGTVTTAKEGTNYRVTYKPNKDWNGTETFKVRVKDAAGAVSGVQTVTVTVKPVNDAPIIAANSTITTDEDTTGTYTVVITDVDFDMPHDSHTIETTQQPKNGSITFVKNGRNYDVQYTPNLDWNGTDTLKVRVKDEAGAYSNEQLITVTVNPVNDAAILAARQEFEIDEDTELYFTVEVEDVDFNMPGDSHTIQVLGMYNSTVTVISGGEKNNPTHKIRVVPNKDWNGTERLHLQVTDEAGELSNWQDVIIVVRPVNDAPVAVEVLTDVIQVDQYNASQWHDIKVEDVDLPNHDNHSFSISGNLQGGTVEFDGYRLRYIADGGFYGDMELTITATDEAGESVSNTFKLFVRELLWQETIRLPSVAGVFMGRNNRFPIMTEPYAKKLDEYELRVLSASTLGLQVDGEVIEIGSGVTYNDGLYQTRRQELGLPIGSNVTGQAGEAILGIYPADFTEPAKAYRVEFYTIETELKADTFEVISLLQPIDIKVQHKGEQTCRITLMEGPAESHDALNDPVCLLEWVEQPDEATLAAWRDSNGLLLPALKGRAHEIGTQPISFDLYMYNGKKERVLVEHVSTSLNVLDPNGAVKFKPAEDKPEVMKSVELYKLQLVQDDGPTCSPTTNRDFAIAQAASHRTFCLITWGDVPSTLADPLIDSLPRMHGLFESLGEAKIEWHISIFTNGGEEVDLGMQVHKQVVVAPTLPTITVESKHKYGDNYVVPMNESLLGYAHFESDPADLLVSIARDDVEIESEVYYAGNIRAKNRILRVLDADHSGGLYSQSNIKLQAAYDLLPASNTEMQVKVISSPSTDVQPYFELDTNQVLDTEELPLVVSMINRRLYDRDYRPEYGQWEVTIYQRISSVRDGERIVQLSDAQKTNMDGQTFFSIDMSKIEGTSARLFAAAKLVHEIPEYEREAESRGVFVSVLFGSGVEGEVTSRKYSGESIYNAQFQFVPDRENLRATRAMGETRWHISADGGETWEITEPNQNRTLSRKFEKGIYLIKATSYNKFSGAEFDAAEVELVVYDKPTLKLDGPTRLMIGDTANFRVIPYIHGEERSTEDFSFSWSTDKGETWVEGSNEYSVTQDGVGTYQLRVRVKEVDAPEDDAKAWTEMRINPRFYPVRGPKIGLRAPYKVEVGKEYTVVATARSRVPGMQGQIIGEFVMSDGTRHRGTELTYIPTKEEELEGRVSVSYEAWFEGFEKDGFSSRSTNMRVWEYVWPNFKIRPFGTIRFAPTKIQMSIVQEKSATVLEKPYYTWTLPEGAEIIRQVGGRIEFMLNKGGDYEIAANISDARGHSSDVAFALNLEDAPAWEIESKVTYSNEIMREPVVISYRPQFSGGHPRDRIVSKKFYVNGELFKEGGFTAKQELRAGKHTIAVEMESRYGQFARDEVEVDVIKNIPPVCSIEVVDLGSKWRVIPQCEDEDGIVRRLEWLVNDVASSGSKYKTFIKSRLTEPYVVQVSALDDSGDSSDPRWVTLNPEPKPDASESTGNDTGAGSDDENQGAEVDE